VVGIIADEKAGGVAIFWSVYQIARRKSYRDQLEEIGLKIPGTRGFAVK